MRIVKPWRMIDRWMNRLYGVIIPWRNPRGANNWLN